MEEMGGRADAREVAEPPSFTIPVSDCCTFVAGEIGPSCFDPWEGGEPRPKYGVIVWYESREIAALAVGAACEAHWGKTVPASETSGSPP